ncbi:MAG: ATP-binding protein [Planctomycetaceae bacterium]|nr:ATP-binding protein [Planctomycetaceae bacterium]
MLPQIELFCIGFAAVIDTVLLLVVLERINRPLTAIWLKWAMLGATMWHVGSFLHTTLRETNGTTAQALDAACMITMAGGLLLLNCGILHAGLRLNSTGAIAHPPRSARYIAVYVPVMMLPLIGYTIIKYGNRDFIESTKSFHLPFLIWMATANLTASGLFLKNRHQLQASAASADRFLVKFSIGLVGVTFMATFYVLSFQDLRWEPQLRLLTNLSPLVPTLVFAYYTFRRRLLPMVFERTLVYGGILLAVFYLHRLTLSELMSRYGEEFKFDFVVVEGLLLVALVLAYQPLRNRFRESLRYLIGGDVARTRDATRNLSVELSRRSGDELRRIADWFVGDLVQSLGARFIHLTLRQHSREEQLLQVADVPNEEVIRDRLKSDATAALTDQFRRSELRWVDRSRCRVAEQLSAMRDLDVIAAFGFRYRGIEGCLIVGSLLNGDRLADEQLNMVSLLVDQFAATIHNRQLEQARQTAERRAVQQEKLSTLGLLSGSLAHELKNPLSSMRTIATLLREDLGADDEHARDVELIIGEIDRLNTTTQRLLDFSRPSDATHVGVAPDRVIERLLHILGHLARQHSVEVRVDLHLGDVLVECTDSTLSEILFNLIKNAIEAVRETPDPYVEIRTALAPSQEDERQVAVMTIMDNGAGISAELQDHIFEPFVTGKPDGTGLGLYLVGERVRELNGIITCSSQSSGTSFEVRLPCQPLAKATNV